MLKLTLILLANVGACIGSVSYLQHVIRTTEPAGDLWKQQTYYYAFSWAASYALGQIVLCIKLLFQIKF